MNKFINRFKSDYDVYKLNQQKIQAFVEFTKNPSIRVMSISIDASLEIQKINDLGFFTTNSQTGETGICYDKNLFDESLIGLKKYENHERAYCEGFIKKDMLKFIDKYLKKLNTKIKMITELIEYEYVYTYDYKYKKKLANKYINLTKEIHTFENGKVEENDFTNLFNDCLERSYMSKCLNDGVYGTIEMDPINLNRKWIPVIFIDYEYGHNALEKNGLFTILIEMLNKFYE